MANTLSKTKHGDTRKKATIAKHQGADKTQMEKGGKILEDAPIIATWYRFIEMRGQKWAEFDDSKIPERDAILGSFSEKFRSQVSWGVQDILDETDGGRF